MRWVFSIVLLLLFVSCKERKVKTIADADLTLGDFILLAPQVKLPFIVHDTTLQKKENDSAAINFELFKSFLPDSVFQKHYPATKQLKVFVLGKSTDAQKGNYLFVKSSTGKRKAVYLYYFNAKNNYTGTMKLLDNTIPTRNNRFTRIDGRYNIAFVKEQKTPTGEVWTDETIYYLDGNGKVILAMTNSTEDRSDEIMGNPIDTLPRKYKYSADYSSDKKNLVSIRDGSTPKTFQFFIHFSKQNGDCIGEIKGEGEFTENDRGVFHDKDSECEILFNFSSTAVTIKETNGCGSYRDITCFFEGSYPKKKELKKTKKK
ncbi:MAG TPA: hypothetical protein VFV46_08915 [Lacibacter sp.]|nr:hypothetical protein [Lacibacter sp.]